MLGTRQIERARSLWVPHCQECSLLQSFLLNHSESRASNMKGEITDSEERTGLYRYITRVAINVTSTKEPFKPVA